DTNLLQAARAALHALELALGEAAESNALCRILRRAIAANETPNPPKSPAVRCSVSYVFASASSEIGIQCDEPAFVTCEHCGPICLSCLANVGCLEGHQHKFSSGMAA